MENPLVTDTTHGDAEVPFLQDLRAEQHKHRQPGAHRCAHRDQLWGLQQHPLDIFYLHRNPLLYLQTPPIHSRLMLVNLALNSAGHTRGKLRQYCVVLYHPGNFLEKLLKLCLLQSNFLHSHHPQNQNFSSQD